MEQGSFSIKKGCLRETPTLVTFYGNFVKRTAERTTTQASIRGRKMDLPVYITVEEVQRVCKALKISDWTQNTEGKVTSEEARLILNEINTEGMPIDLEDFRMGLEVELEHGTRFKEANVTNNHPILTGKIVVAHFKEMLDYYQRLEVAELEGDILKALVAKNYQKLEKYAKKLVEARMALSKAEAKALGM
jgi:hypothetical protein